MSDTWNRKKESKYNRASNMYWHQDDSSWLKWWKGERGNSFMWYKAELHPSSDGLRYDRRGYSDRPSWWFNLTSDRPNRRKVKCLCNKILNGELEDALFPLARKPKEYWD